MFEINLPEWTSRQGTCYPARRYKARLVEILLAYSPQPPELISLYYGDNAPASAFKPTKSDRLIFYSDEYGYLIVPNVPRNKNMWKQVKNIS